MTWSIDSILQDPMLERVGWALVHSVWQGTAIAAALAGLFLFTRRSKHRYILPCSALILAMLCPIATTIWIATDSQATTQWLRHYSVATTVAPVRMDQPTEPPITPQHSINPPTARLRPLAPRTSISDAARSVLPYASVLWAAGVMVLCMWHIAGLFEVRSLRRSAVAISDRSCLSILTRLCERLAIRQSILLSECAHVTVPCVIGFFRPMVLLPVGMIANLSPQYLESILAHELAHIRRHDYLINLAQIAIETLLFYHPAVWWISKQIRQEREHCCDDMAVEIVGDATTYSEALTVLEERRIGLSQALTLGVTGGSLLHRIARLLNHSPEQSRSAWPIASLMLAVIIASGAAPMAFRRSRAQAQIPVPASQPVAETQHPATRGTEQAFNFPSPDAFTLEQRILATPATHPSTQPARTTGPSGDAGFHLDYALKPVPPAKIGSSTLNVVFGPASALDRNSLPPRNYRIDESGRLIVDAGRGVESTNPLLAAIISEMSRLETLKTSVQRQSGKDADQANTLSTDIEILAALRRKVENESQKGPLAAVTYDAGVAQLSAMERKYATQTERKP